MSDEIVIETNATKIKDLSSISGSILNSNPTPVLLGIVALLVVTYALFRC